ncbi:hypothetical protein [Candidatus Mycobacterium methanotrophicum]|uniref:Transposase n=1 Tax=Candidatus Mycobacterium methanotrophicum TaxID=2943498 RepID=A0ABY4QT55_9MYCO|nr:hypothetical protein [Candidatus Mycobacterium methanotrophicum]UQX12835.1 hypothetical protein M5I08_12290 [Candidatus Mycobacterium methanotrophicum]
MGASVKAGICGLVGHAVVRGWPARAACRVLDADDTRVARWAARRAAGTADRLANYLHSTGRDQPQPPTGPATTPTCSSIRSASPPTACAPTAESRYSKPPSPVSSFTEQD